MVNKPSDRLSEWHKTLMALNAKKRVYRTEDIKTQQISNSVLGKPGSSVGKGIIESVHLCKPP